MRQFVEHRIELLRRNLSGDHINCKRIDIQHHGQIRVAIKNLPPLCRNYFTTLRYVQRFFFERIPPHDLNDKQLPHVQQHNQHDEPGENLYPKKHMTIRKERKITHLRRKPLIKKSGRKHIQKPEYKGDKHNIQRHFYPKLP